MSQPEQSGGGSERAGRPGRPERQRGELRELARNRLIESRLTPNAISMTGLVLNLAAAVLILEDLFVLGALAFIVGSIMDTLDGRYSRMSGKGIAVRGLPRFHPRPDRGGGRPRRGLLAVREGR